MSRLITALVADSQPGIASLVEHLLAERGARVLDASHGWEAWRLIRDLKPEFVLLDAHLLYVNGFELTRAIKRHPETAHIRVAISGSDMEAESIQKAQAVGADVYLAKPFTADDFLALFQKLTRGVA